MRGPVSGERLTIWTVGLLLVGVSLLIGFAGTPYTPPPDAVESAAADHGVDIQPAWGGYTIRPADGGAGTGFVFYPGARVDPGAYVPVLAPVVEETGVAVFVPRPRLNLAVLEPGMADPILAANPAIGNWYVGGHSLGGAMACRYAAGNADRVAGLVLFGSYCDRSIADHDLTVLAVGGTADTVLGTDPAAVRPRNLPPDATVRYVEGLNHTQFGSYRGQAGDSPASIPRPVAHSRLQELLVTVLEDP